MTANEGALDRGLRLVLGLALVAGAFVGPKTPWGLVGIVPLATGLLGYCPTYALLGISTRRAGPGSGAAEASRRPAGSDPVTPPRSAPPAAAPPPRPPTR
jgi:hypothetical protein